MYFDNLSTNSSKIPQSSSKTHQLRFQQTDLDRSTELCLLSAEEEVTTREVVEVELGAVLVPLEVVLASPLR